MAADDVRKRLEALNRAPLKNVPPEGASRDRPPRETERPAVIAPPTPAIAPRANPGPVITLAEALPGAAMEHESGRLYWRVDRDVAACGPWTEVVTTGARTALSSDRLLSRLRAHDDPPPTSVTLVDIETLGLTTSEPLFLIGTLRLDLDGAIHCAQAIARDLDEEAGVLEAFSDSLAATGVLVSFNGISFDLAMIRGRAAAHDVALPPLPPHVDVLLDARHRYGRRLPNCRLMTLEERVCGRTRTDDVPGREVPGVYTDYLRTGNASGIARIAQHNVLDLLTTADLFARFYAE